LKFSCECFVYFSVWTSTIGRSHTNFVGSIADTLKEDGHNVKEQVFNVVLGLNVLDFAKMQLFAYNVCKGILGDSLLIGKLRESRYDIGIFEMFHSCPAGIPKTMLVSAIGMGYHHYRLLGMEKQTSFVPGWLFANICEYSEQNLFNSMFPGFPRLHNLIQEFERIVSKSSKGVILFSLGSLVKSSDMPMDVRRAFTEAFQSFPDYVILWKEDRKFNITNSNIFYYDWIPQVDLLADGRVKLFITHAGMNSIQEALLFGVPMVTVPLFADQYTNAAVAEERGFSVTLNKLSLSREDIIKAINTVLGDNAERLRQGAEYNRSKGFAEVRIRKGNIAIIIVGALIAFIGAIHLGGPSNFRDGQNSCRIFRICQQIVIVGEELMTLSDDFKPHQSRTTICWFSGRPALNR
uniref:UDP-glucuronosyltransferase n=1 Tax=Haemonchus placei TaxID=6290 RepID=A0A158QJQ4_HAEPC